MCPHHCIALGTNITSFGGPSNNILDFSYKIHLPASDFVDFCHCTIRVPPRDVKIEMVKIDFPRIEEKKLN